MTELGQKVYARIPFKYAGVNLDRGQVHRLGGHRNDGKLLGLRYFMKFNSIEHKQFQCDNCGVQFVTDGFLIGHQKKTDCKAAEQKISTADTADIVDADPAKMVVDEAAAFTVDETTETL